MRWTFILLMLILAPFAGGLLFGADRKITARLQGRIGPPLTQPFFDVIKLAAKDAGYTSQLQAFFIWSYFIWMVTSLYILVSGQDFMIFVFTLAFSEVSLALAGFATRSPYSHIGSSRELMQMLAAEPVLILLAVGLYIRNGTFLGAGVLLAERPLLTGYPLLFLAVLLVLSIKMRKSPFDVSASTHAHQELVRGVTTEFSGRYLALVEVTHWLELVVFLFIVFLFWATPWWAGILLAAAAYLLELVVDNLYARMNIGWLLRFAWAWGLGLSFFNLLFNIAARRL